MVRSTRTSGRSGSSATYRCISVHPPHSAQRAKRLNTLCQRPRSAGSRRHCAPLRSTPSTAFRNRRQSSGRPTYTRGWAARKAHSVAHGASVKLARSMSHLKKVSYPTDPT
jgi:hypothetical protein